MHDGAHALVVDPPRDLAPVEQAAESAGVDITAVADTHVHSDFASGAAALARRHRAPYLLSGEERVEFDRVPVHGGDVVPVGALEVPVIATPGDTRHHQSFVVRHGEAGPSALFSGGSLLHGTVGRTDLVDPLLARLLGRPQWQGAQQQVVLPSDTSLHPARHGQHRAARRRVHLLGPVADWPEYGRMARTDWQGYAEQRRPNDVVLDVRRAPEHDADHLPQARNVPLPELWRGAARLPPGRVWVHCRSGSRAATAAGLLARLGRETVLVDDDWSRVGAIGLATDRAA